MRTRQRALSLFLALALALTALPGAALAVEPEKAEDLPLSGEVLAASQPEAAGEPEALAASSGSCGENGGSNVRWSLDSSGTLIISGSGNMKDFGPPAGSSGAIETPPWRDDCVTVVIEEGVASVGSFAFFNCPKLKRADIAGSVKSVGSKAFYLNSLLESVDFGEGVTAIGEQAFCECRELQAVRLPDSLTSIESGAFWNCASLTEVVIPRNVTSVGANTFTGCESLTKVTAPEGLALPDLPAGVETETYTGPTPGGGETGGVEPQTWNCGGRDANNPDASVTASLDSQGTLTVSGTGAMCDYSILTAPWKDPSYGGNRSGEIKRVVVEAGVTHIGNEAFLACPNLESVEIAGSVETIGTAGQAGNSRPFSDCPKLTRLTILPGDGCAINDMAFSGCSALTEVTLGEGVSVIGSGAFASCSSLETIRFPASLTAIGHNAFQNCSRLRTLALPEKLASIGQNSFSSCTSLESVRFPDSLTDIGSSAFYQCAALKEVILPKNLTSLGRTAFYDSGVVRAAVPQGLTLPDAAFPDGAEVRTYTGETPADFDSIPGGGDGGENPGGGTGGENPGGGTGGGNPGGGTGGGNPGGGTGGENPGGGTGGGNPGGGTGGGNPGGGTGGGNPGGGTGGENPGGGTGGENPGGGTGGENPTPPAEIVSSGDCGKVSGTVTWTLDANGLLTVRGSGEMRDYSRISYGPRPWGENNVKALVIEEGVTKVGGYAFHQHTALKSVQLPESLTAIGSNAFTGCAALPSVTIPQAVTSLGYNAFSECGSLTEARVHRQLKQIPSNVFPASCTVTRYGTAGGDCGKVSGTVSWTLDGDGLLTIQGTGEMKDFTYYASSVPWDAAGVKAAVIKEGVTGVGDYAFYQHGALESVRLPDSLRTIGRGAFQYCAALTEITLPRSLESVRNKLLFYKSGLTRARVFYRTEYDPGDFPDGCLISLYGKTLTPEAPLRASRTAPAGSDNAHAGHWSRPDCSYLAAGEDGGFYRVDYDRETGLVMEEYGPGGAFYQGWDIPMELPEFGGFFSGSDGFYFVFGQENPQESDSVEVLRVVKYTKDLERLGAASLSGGNTREPFHAAGCRMAEGNGLLYIHTGHRMMKSSDGVNHQACMTFSVDTEIMEFQYKFYGVAHYETNGYVSHSFDQYIRVDGDRVVRLDLGDAGPRGAALFVDGPSLAGRPRYTVAMEWSGGTGDNNTGSWLGGLEVSQSAYLTALSSVDQNSGNRHNNETFNVYLLATDKETLKTRTVQVTHYGEGGPLSVDAPRLVKLSDNRFLVLWEEQSRRDSSYGGYFSYSDYTGTVKYAFFDGEGNQLGGVQSMSGAMSDCQPEVIDGKAVWYVTEDGGKPVFYQIGSDGKAGSFTPSAGQKPSGGSVTLPGDIRDALANGTPVFAASYNGGRMTGLVPGTVKDGKAVFGKRIPKGWTLYFLDGNGAPVCPAYTVA